MDIIKFDVTTHRGKRINGEPDLVVCINGQDVIEMELFKGEHKHSDVASFLFNEWMWHESFDDSVFNGIRLIAVCFCGVQGCDDLIAKICTDDAVTSWMVYRDHNEKIRKDFVFDKKDYENQIEALSKQYFSYSWENREHRLTRLCTEFIRTYTTKDGIPIREVKVNRKNKILELLYDNGWIPAGPGYARNTEALEVRWDGRTTKDALTQIKKYAENNLVRNTEPVNLRKEAFSLLYIKDKSMIGLEGDLNDD
jgi:hypothetical protein